LESELIKACIKNNQYAQKVFYETYAPLVKGVCIRYEYDRDEVKDLIHDIFIKIFKNLSKYSSEGALEGWIKRIAVNYCLDHINKKKKKSTISIDETNLNEVESFYDEIEEQNIVNQIIDFGITKEKLIELIHTLPQNYSAVFNMYYIDNLNHEHISNTFSINENLSRKWLQRSKEMIRTKILEQLNSKN